MLGAAALLTLAVPALGEGRILQPTAQEADQELRQLLLSLERESLGDSTDEVGAEQVSSGEETIDVLTWNILARSFTKYSKDSRPNIRGWDGVQCVQGHLNPHDELETIHQTKQRYTLATFALLAKMPGVALLQEAEPAFFDLERNPGAEALTRNYEVIQSSTGGKRFFASLSPISHAFCASPKSTVPRKRVARPRLRRRSSSN
jgi:hypothetical protein